MTTITYFVGSVVYVNFIRENTILNKIRIVLSIPMCLHVDIKHNIKIS